MKESNRKISSILKILKYKKELNAINKVVKSCMKFPEIVLTTILFVYFFNIIERPMKLPILFGVIKAVKFPT